MSPIKTIIVDDERPAREEMRRLLEEFPFVEIVGDAASVAQAAKLVKEFQPQLLFLDIGMPGRDGFELLEALPAPRPHVIFTTAYDAFAIRAFEVSAVDYLMKPIHPRRLEAALEKARERLDSGTAAPAQPTGGGLAEDDHVFVRDGDRSWFVPVRSIWLLEAEGNHTRLYFDQEKPLLHRSLLAMEERLPAKMFLRANRSQIINLRFIETIGQWFSGSLKVRLRGGGEVEFSRRQAQIFRERMSL